MLTPKEKTSLPGTQARVEPQCYIMQDSKPNALPTELFQPHTNDSKPGTPMTVMPGAWCYRVSSGLVGHVSVYYGRVRYASLICCFCLSVAARKTVQTDLSQSRTSMLLGRKATSKHR